MRQTFDPVVMRALRPVDDLLSEKAKGAFLRAPAWDGKRAAFCAGLIDSTAVVFHIWLAKLSPARSETVRSLDQESLEAIGEFFAWLVLFCFSLSNEITPEMNSVILNFYEELFPETLGFTRSGFSLFRDANKGEERLDQADLEGMDEADRWTVEHLPFLRPAAATLGALSGFGALDKRETLGLQPDLAPTLSSAVLHFANAVGIRANALVPT